MSFIFATITPVFILVSLGYITVRLKYFPKDGVHVLAIFVNSIAAPALLFRAMLNMDFSTAFKISLVGPYYIAAISIFFLTIVIARVFFKRRPGEAVSIGFSACFINGLMLGIPIIQRAYGEEGLTLLYTVIGLHAPLLYTIGMITMEMSRRDGESLAKTLRVAGKKVVTQPIVIGIFLGFVGNLVGFRQPGFLEATTSSLTLAVVPCALFGIGGALNNYKLSSVWFQASVVTFMKLLVMPTIVWVILIPIMHTPIETARVFILLSSLPTGINGYIFATYYDRGVNVATNVILIGTVAGFFSISFWLWVLQ